MASCHGHMAVQKIEVQLLIMKKKILPFLILVVLSGVWGCAEEVVPTDVSLETELIIELDDERSTDDEERKDEGEDPDLG